MSNKHVLHKGEAVLQKRRGTPKDLSVSMPDYIDRDMPDQHAEFFAGLTYLPLATLDGMGRPWASLMVTTSSDDPTLAITIFGGNHTEVVAETNPYDPFVRALQQTAEASEGEEQLFAGVGVDFSNRRRNKLAGSIRSLSIEATGKVSLQLISNQHLGNCPKYITVRSLRHEVRQSELILDQFEEVSAPLPDSAKALIERSSTTFLATKHSGKEGEDNNDQSDMGLNHRGGAPGFVRLYETSNGSEVTTYLVLPDHSGNRFYQSLGNIETDKQVGLVFPDFVTGDVLYVTGNAENLFDAEAEAIMPRVSLLTCIEITGAVFVKNGLNLRLVSDEQFSPYNPPVKYLKSELEEMGHAASMQETSKPLSATLVSTTVLSETISTFSFELSSSIDLPLPGGFGVFDLSSILDSGYRHMDEANPQLVNEDYIRTWTLSSAPDFDAASKRFVPTGEVNITVKRKPGGLISNFLHQFSAQLMDKKAPIEFKGTGAGFTCFTSDRHTGLISIPAKMLWLAGGVGITPFMTMWDGINNVAKALPGQLSSDIVLVFSGRGDDVGVLKHFLTLSKTLPENINLRVLIFQSAGEDRLTADAALARLQNEFPNAPMSLEQRRVQIGDLREIGDLKSRDIYLCGPDSLMNWCDRVLGELGIDKRNLHKESFSF